MKYINTFIFVCFSHIFLLAQLTPQTKVGQEKGPLESQIVANANTFPLQQLRDERSILRMGLEQLSLPLNNRHLDNLHLSYGLFVAYEKRLKTGFSLLGQISYRRPTYFTTTIASTPMFVWASSEENSVDLFISPRWYLGKRQQVAQRTSGNNLSGWYAGASLGVNIWRQRFVTLSAIDSQIERPTLSGNFQYGLVHVGWQKRFGKIGLLNFDIGAGIKRNARQTLDGVLPSSPEELALLAPLPKWQGLLVSKIGVGVAIGKVSSQEPVPYTILSYHEANRAMWKIDLMPLLLFVGRNGYDGAINFGYERNIAESAFSINTNLRYDLAKNIHGHSTSAQLFLQTAPRFYYNIKKRIRKGKTADRLSADYVSLRHQWRLIDTPIGYTPHGFSVFWGMQRRMFQRLFVNYQFGYSFSNRFNERYGEIGSELKIGFAF
ncbi:MAG: hypothetical protein AAF960_21695 [Bacteroidota bacterium]